MSTNAVIAATFGWESSEVRDYRYQQYTAPAVYAVGNEYFAVSKKMPRHSDIGGTWKPHSDQFFASKEGTTLWVCEAV